jgi:hypothetical protein
MAGSCEYEPSVFIKYLEILEQPSDWWVLYEGLSSVEVM